jgi:RND family efflux transporter MFP subunit
VTGELQPVRRALLAAEEEGLVVEVIPEEGDLVKQGDVVARLRDVRARLEVERAESEVGVRQATLAERQAELARARHDLERIEALQSAASAAWKELEDKRTGVLGAEARVQAAEAELTSAKSDLNWTREKLSRLTVQAPFTGRVIAKRTEVGQWLRQGDGVVELLGMDHVDARLDVPERFMHRLVEVSVPIRIRIQATGEVIEAPISGVIPLADPRSRLFPVRVRLDNSAGKLQPGLSITGMVPTGGSEATLTVHKDAIRRDEAGEFVFFDANGAAAMARVRTLFPVGNRVAIEPGALTAGARVVIEGNERMMPGQPLIPAGPARGAPGSEEQSSAEAPAGGAQGAGQHQGTTQGR